MKKDERSDDEDEEEGEVPNPTARATGADAARNVKENQTPQVLVNGEPVGDKGPRTRGKKAT